MKLHPPPVVNNQVTADMLRWVMRQPNTVTMNTATNEFTITPGKGAQDYPISLSDRIIMLRELIAILAYNGFNAYEQTTGTLMVKKRGWSFEVPGILDQMPFPEYLPHQINKAYEYWKYEQNSLNRAMSYELSTVPYNLYTDTSPSADSLSKADKAFEDMVKHGSTMMRVYTDMSHDYPSREHLEKVKQMITDSMGVSAELLGNNDSRSDIVREAEDSIDDTNKD